MVTSTSTPERRQRRQQQEHHQRDQLEEEEKKEGCGVNSHINNGGSDSTYIVDSERTITSGAVSSPVSTPKRNRQRRSMNSGITSSPACRKRSTTSNGSSGSRSNGIGNGNGSLHYQLRQPNNVRSTSNSRESSKKKHKFASLLNHRKIVVRFILLWVFVLIVLVVVVDRVRGNSAPLIRLGGSQSNNNNSDKDKNNNGGTFYKYTSNAPKCDEIIKGADDISYTLVTQLSQDRLWMMEYHCERWQNQQPSAPISIAILTNETKTFIEEQLQRYGCDVSAVTVQIESLSPSPTKTSLSSSTTTNSTIELALLNDYPVNKLRNLALQSVKTSHVVYVDVDFWVSNNLYSILHNPKIKEFFFDNKLSNRNKHNDNQSSSPVALVLPAFQLNRQCTEYRECPEKNLPHMPKTIPEFYYLMKDRKISRFDPTNRGGHGSTLYKEWLFNQTTFIGKSVHKTRNDDESDGDNSVSLLQIPCFTSNRYEPYLVFEYCYDLPPFQEQFTGYGKNKMTWVMQLRRYGYTFHQLGNAFVVHYPHLDSKARTEWNVGPPPETVEQQLKKNKQLQQRQRKKRQLLRQRRIENNEDDVEDSEEIQLEEQKQENSNSTPIDWLQYKRGRMDRTFVQFKTWLIDNVPDEAKTPLCSDAEDDDARLWVDSSTIY